MEKDHITQFIFSYLSLNNFFFHIAQPLIDYMQCLFLVNNMEKAIFLKVSVTTN